MPFDRKLKKGVRWPILHMDLERQIYE